MQLLTGATAGPAPAAVAVVVRVSVVPGGGDGVSVVPGGGVHVSKKRTTTCLSIGMFSNTTDRRVVGTACADGNRNSSMVLVLVHF